MPSENLKTIGDQLRAEYETWLAGFSMFGPDHSLRAASDWETLGQAQADFARSMQEIQTWLDLDSWLTSGFLPAPGVVSPHAPASQTGLTEHSSRAWPAASPVSPPSFSPEEFSPPGSQPAGPSAASSFGVQESMLVRPDMENPSRPSSQKSAARLAAIGSLSDLARMVQITPYNDEAEAPEHPLESPAAPSFTRTRPGAKDALFEPPGLSLQTRVTPLASSEVLNQTEEWQPTSFTDETLVTDDDMDFPSRTAPPVALSVEAAFLSPTALAETDLPPVSLQPVGRPAVRGSDIDLSGRPGVDWDTPEKSAEIRSIDAPPPTPSNAFLAGRRFAPEIMEGVQENPAEASFSAGELARLGSELAAGFFSAPAPLTSAGSQPDSPHAGAATDWLTLLAAVTWPGRMPSLPLEKIAGQPVETLGQHAPSSQQTPGWNDTLEVVRQIVETGADTAANSPTLSSLDVQDMLDALRQEIWREYRRFYGTTD